MNNLKQAFCDAYTMWIVVLRAPGSTDKEKEIAWMDYVQARDAFFGISFYVPQRVIDKIMA